MLRAPLERRWREGGGLQKGGGGGGEQTNNLRRKKSASLTEQGEHALAPTRNTTEVVTETATRGGDVG